MVMYAAHALVDVVVATTRYTYKVATFRTDILCFTGRHRINQATKGSHILVICSRFLLQLQHTS